MGICVGTTNYLLKPKKISLANNHIFGQIPTCSWGLRIPKNCGALPPSTSHENLGEKREQVECRSSWKYGTVGTSQLTHIQKRWLLQPGHWNQECNKMVRFTTGVVKMLSGRVLSRFYGSCLVCRINLIFSTPLTGCSLCEAKKILACSRPINIEIFHFEGQKTFRKKGKPKSWLYLSWFYEGEKLPPPPFWYLESLSTQLSLNHFVKSLPNKACQLYHEDRLACQSMCIFFFSWRRLQSECQHSGI